jgi:circadian clock protein KaiC
LNRQTAGEKKRRKRLSEAGIDKCPSGILGLDEITHGGLPRGRPTLICGGPGCGKTLFAMEFLIRGATAYGENGVFMSFEENAKELTENVASLAFDVKGLERQKKLAIDYVHVDRNEIEETGEYDLEGLFVRLKSMIQSVGAKRVVLDTLETLFGGMTNTTILRSELRRLFRWLKDSGMTAIITAERGEADLTRHGLEEYVSDCVILLDHRVDQQNTTRTLRVVKYRGSLHGTNEYPFLIDEDGISVLPITSLGLNSKASNERVPTGIPRLDEMLGGKGYFKGSTILLSGTAGTGKTSIAASLAVETCRAGARCLYLAYEESVSQLARNMRSIGIDLQPHIDAGLLKVISARPYLYGLEMHLVQIHKLVRDFEPAVVIVDPITNLSSTGTFFETRSMMTRLIDFLKNRGVTSCFTSLTEGGRPAEDSEVGVSSLIDTWLAVRAVEIGGERNRLLMIVKSRGMAHSNQTSEFVLTRKGIHLLDTSIGAAGVLTGSARLAEELQQSQERRSRSTEISVRKAALDRKRHSLEAQLLALKAECEAESEEVEALTRQEADREQRLTTHKEQLARSRWAFKNEGVRGRA